MRIYPFASEEPIEHVVINGQRVGYTRGFTDHSKPSHRELVEELHPETLGFRETPKENNS